MRANERRMRLIEELCERKFDTIDNLAFELGVSRRTICYDIEELSLSYPIFTAKGTGGGVWVRDGYRLGRRYLTEKQRELLERLSAGLTAKDAEIMESILSQFTLARGTMDGRTEKKRYYLMSKKIYSRRFSTDCFSDYFDDMARQAPVGLDGYLEYATEKASVEELKSQHSYFIDSLYRDGDDGQGGRSI